MSELADWERRSLESLATYINGYAFKPSDWKTSGLPIVRIAQITGSAESCDYFDGVLNDDLKLGDEDLVFSWSGTLAVVRWRGGPAWLNQHLFRVIPAEGVDRRYLYHVLQHAVQEMDKRAHGSTMKHIKRTELQNYNVAVPRLAGEQAAIARILDTLDTQIERTQALIAKLELVKEGLLHDLLTRGVDENGELRPSPEDSPELYKESPLGLIPKSWECISLRQAALPTRESFTDGDWIEAPYITQDGVRLLQTGNVGVGEFIEKPNSRKFVSSSTFKLLKCKLVLPGDLLVCRLADPIGRACEVPASVGDAITSVDCTILRVDSRMFVKQVLLAWINSRRHLQNAQDRAAGSTRSRISRLNMANLPIPKPPIHEQTRMSALLNALQQDIEQERLTDEKLRTQKSGLMDELLTGRVRVTPLLEREAAATS